MARPSKPIKWEEVILRMKAGNSAVSIANAFDVSIATFYERFNSEFDCTFPDKKAELLENGSDDLQYMQFKKAMGGSERMLLWLGQVRLGQKPPESASSTYTPEDKEKIERIHEQLSSMSESLTLNNSRINSSKEV